MPYIPLHVPHFAIILAMQHITPHWSYTLPKSLHFLVESVPIDTDHLGIHLIETTVKVAYHVVLLSRFWLIYCGCATLVHAVYRCATCNFFPTLRNIIQYTESTNYIHIELMVYTIEIYYAELKHTLYCFIGLTYVFNIQKWLTLSKPKNKLILGLLIVNSVYILVMWKFGTKKAHPFLGCALIPLPSLSYISSLSLYLNVPSLMFLRTSIALSPYQPYSLKNWYRYFIVVCE